MPGITNSEVDLGRINPVLSYIIENFRNEVSLDEAAHTANMSATAFCKYFKKMTNKTFIETVNEYRVSNAMMLLIQSDKPVNHICYDSGFTDVSHFYRTFKRKTGHSPLGYRMKFFRRASL